MMTFTATREQRDNLEGLAYWVSDRAWSRERGELDEHEDHRTDTTIRAIFDALDRLGVRIRQNNIDRSPAARKEEHFMTSIEIKNTRLNVSVSAEAETVKRSAADLLTHLDSFLSLVEDGAFEGDPISEAVYACRNAVSSALETFDARARETAETLKGYEDKQRAEVNPMCKTCKAFGSTCNGTTCMTYTGCIYKR